MSRAFVKEPDGDPPDDELPPRPPRVEPCYMTSRGVATLRAELETLTAAIRVDTADDADLSTQSEQRRLKLRRREIVRILSDVTSVDVSAQTGTVIRFGATVRLTAADGTCYTFSIVGEDEIDAGAGRISWVSPLGRSLIGLEVGDAVTWQRPVGALELEIAALDYQA